eukprot:6820441-Pyramimonas_sp.AAC.1
MWKFDDDTYTGIAALDSHWGFMTDFMQTLRHALWRRASQHFCGTGLEQGVDCASCQILLQQLAAAHVYGHRLSEVMLARAVG